MHNMKGLQSVTVVHIIDLVWVLSLEGMLEILFLLIMEKCLVPLIPIMMNIVGNAVLCIPEVGGRALVMFKLFF